jgi:quinoprotein glucose dehydrogenase
MRRSGRELIASSLGSRALQIASEIGEMPLDEEELLKIASDASAAPSARASALASLASRTDLPAAREAALASLDAGAPEVRSAARDLLRAVDAEAGLEALLAATLEADALSERQHAWRRLGAIDDVRARTRLGEALDAWARDAVSADSFAGEPSTPRDFAQGVALEVLLAARDHAEPGLAARGRALLEATSDSPVRQRRWALAGGDVEAGREVFQTHGDCQRCHRVEASAGAGPGHGAGVGPPLAGVGRRRGATYVLESILDPQARIADGFATVVVTRRDGSTLAGLLVEEDATEVSIDPSGGTSDAGSAVSIPRSTIASISAPVSGMPPIGLGLDPAALRDLVAYVTSLE